MANKAGHAEAYKDVIHEDAIKIGGNTKAPDYCFRIGGARKFFLEAKKPAVNLKDEISPAYQLRRYAWSAKLSLSILTDFEEFAVYDCRTRPSPSDKSSTGRILYLTYRDYLTKWEEIACIFAKEAILKGSFDKYALSDRKRGTATVDAEFLKEIESWRESLAKNLATRNPRLSVHELNFGVQRTIDRLIFLRICEDRGIEPSEQLKLILKGKNVYSQLQGIYEKADERYNSGLFHFHPEKDRTESPDDLTPQLKIDDKVLKDIVSRLYYPQSPYEFSVFPPEILGQVYEQFLGKVIRLTSGHQAKVEEKPEIKKAGGIYYTPTYIVEYIGKKTVGLMCEGKTPGQIAQLHILDPACGSGSFLLGAYTYLLDWHLKWYIEHGPEKHGKELFRTMAGNWRLKTVEKRRILLNNVYGVDIDSQAVEVTKLSLLLKVLEGENKESLQELLFGRMRALPDLGQNIKCGNSIVSSEHFADQILPDEDEVRRVNAFDWRTEFPNIFKSGGFDAVIGNPPYVRVGNIDELILSYLYEHYDVAHRFDIYVVFIFKAFDLLSPRGRLGFILPNKFFTADYGKSLRSFLSSRKAVEAVVDFGDSQVFEGASTYTCLLFLNREPQKVFSYLKGDSELLAKQKMSNSSALVDQTQLGEGPWSFLDPTSLQLLTKFANFPRLQDVCQIERGLETGCDEVFFLRVCGHKEEKNKLLVTSKVCPEPFKIERGAVRLLVKGSADVQRYFIESDRALVFPYRHKNGNPELIEARKFEEEFPLAWSYLNDNAQRLKQRGRKEWYSFRRRNYDLRDGVGRVFVPSIGKRLSAAIDPEGVYHFVGSGGGGGGSYALLPNNESNHSIYYILGLINSRLADWFAKLTNSRFGGGYYAFNRQYIEPIPFRQINFASSTEKTFHDRLVIFAQRMVDLHKRLSQATTPNDEEQTRRQIDITDKEIDALVYELYGLTEEEVKVVEAGSAVPLSQSEMKQDVVESELTE
jgi:type I restriction-modification system DNA methylase subunit